ncbi:MAG: hypothetical protein AAGE80_02455 [Pseudomonadota bacterium]
MKLHQAILSGALALGIAAAVPAGPAEAGPRAFRVANALDNVANDIYSLRDVRGPYKRGQKIDRLHRRLDRLEYRSARQPSRLARRNEAEIQDLRALLSRVEDRNNRRIAWLEQDAYVPEPEVVVVESGRRFDFEISSDGIRFGIDR